MEKRYDFDATICERSIFQYVKMNEKDLGLLRNYGIRKWDGKDFSDESILKNMSWVISKDRGMLFIALGGGSFEIPEFYEFVSPGGIVYIECGGGGTRVRNFVHNQDSSYDEEIKVTRTQYVRFDKTHNSIDASAIIAEAFAIYSFRSPHLSKLSVKFLANSAGSYEF